LLNAIRSFGSVHEGRVGQHTAADVTPSKLSHRSRHAIQNGFCLVDGIRHCFAVAIATAATVS
jgi:hypothetical protein